jgi:hypothetical protein
MSITLVRCSDLGITLRNPNRGNVRYAYYQIRERQRQRLGYGIHCLRVTTETITEPSAVAPDVRVTFR